MRISVLAAALLAVALLGPGQALAAPPTNDAFADAATLTFPASPSVDLTEATTEAGEPGGGCWQQARSAWYRLQPATDMLVRFSSTGPFDRVVDVYRDTGSGLAGLTSLGCAYPWSSLEIKLQGGSTYYVQLGAPPWSGAGMAGLDVSVIPPPPNDDFADALAFSSLPFINGIDNRAASVEPGEPTQPTGAPSVLTGTAWYAFTPGQTGPVTIDALCCGFGRHLAVYTGSSVAALTEVPVYRRGLTVYLNATAGTAYRIQDGVNVANGGATIFVQQTPMPYADMSIGPFDPSVFDTVWFQPNAWDPAGLGIDSYTWDFGDGTGATGPTNPTHRYQVDGDYVVSLTVGTPDGRRSTATRTVAVRTRDVAITKLAVPSSGRVNQTKTITIGLVNNREAETVFVTLFRSRAGVNGSWDVVGQSTQFIPSKSKNRTTSIVFSYTFTPEDAAIGKVTFRAVASISAGRDALPGDNELIAPPTTVNP